MNEKDASHTFMTMILTCVTMVRWADVPDSERGDFRRRRAVDISSYHYAQTCDLYFKKQSHICLCGLVIPYE